MQKLILTQCFDLPALFTKFQNVFYSVIAAISFIKPEYVLSAAETLCEWDVSSIVSFGDKRSLFEYNNDSVDDKRASIGCPSVNGARPIMARCPLS